MASPDDQKLIDDITRVLGNDGRTQSGQRAITALQTYADTPSDPAAQEVMNSLENIFASNGVMSQETLHMLAALEATGLDGFYEGIGPDNKRKEEKQDWENFRRSTRALVAQAIQAESTRQFNETMDKLDQQIRDLDGPLNDWLKNKERQNQERQKDWEKVHEFAASNQAHLQQIAESCHDKSPEGAEHTRQKIDTTIEENNDLMAHLSKMRETLVKEAEADEKFIVEYRYRKEEMIEGFETAIKSISDKPLKETLTKVANELRKDHPDKAKIAELKGTIEAQVKALPEGSKDQAKINRLLDAGEKMGPMFWKVAEQLEKRDLQNRRLNEITQEVIQQNKLLNEAKNLPQEERLNAVNKIKALDTEIGDLVQEKQKGRSIADAAEIERLQTVSDRANIAAQKKAESLAEKGYAIASELKDIWGKNVTGGTKRILANGEEAEIFQASQTKLYYTLDKNGLRTYLGGEDQFKLLNEDGYTAERLQEYRAARAAYAPQEDTTPPVNDHFAVAAGSPKLNLPEIKPEPVLQYLFGP
ncbi:MAG: hypothetical protein LRY54_02850 [Alphaproteobacteria bacterium]|nr:hypothetical protein [Alphaproteobacteria bacterium]